MTDKPANGDALRAKAEAAAAERRGQAEGAEPGAAVATRPPAATGDNLAYSLIAGWEPQLRQALARGQDPDRFIRMSAILLSNAKGADKIAACDRPTLYAALMSCAHFGLLPDGRHAAIVPYGTRATFIPMKDGLIQLAFRTGQVRAITCKLIYAADEWAEEIGPQGRGFIHRPARFAQTDAGPVPIPRGRLDAHFRVKPGPGADNPPLLAYCYATFADGQSTEVETMTAQEAIEIRDRHSKAYDFAESGPKNRGGSKQDSFWHTDPELAWLKSVLRRAMHYIPQSAELIELLLADDAADSRNGAAQPYTPPPMPPGGPGAAWEGDVRYGDGTVIPGQAEPAEAAPGPASRAEPRDASEAWAQAAPGGEGAGRGTAG